MHLANLPASSSITISCTNPIGLDTALGLVTLNYQMFVILYVWITDVKKEAKHEPEDAMQLSSILLLLCNLRTSCTFPNATTETVQITHLKIGFDKIQQFLTGFIPNPEAYGETKSIKKPLAIHYRVS